MSTPLLATKLYIPPPRAKAVARPRLIERLNEGLAKDRKLTLVSAPAGFGKTTLVSAWVAGCSRPAAWLALDAGDGDLARFLTYLVAALRTLAPQIGAGVLAVLAASQPPPVEAILTALLNEMSAIPDGAILVLDDYHTLDAKAVDDGLAFLVEHLPPQVHLVIATREDPLLPLARLRARGQLTELRAADLRFTSSEAAAFLNQAMGLELSAGDVAALETRTEGWIAGLQLAALALQGTLAAESRPDAAGFIRSFTGGHHFVLDYLVEEVLQQQPAQVQTFMLRTAILDRLCGPLCDAVVRDASLPGQATLEYMEHANLFIVPLDHERRWYRYHQLFADLLRQRLGRHAEGTGAAALHIRASQWYADQGLDLEAFQHAVAANDVERAARLLVGKGMPLHFRGALAPVLRWLEALPAAELDARPALWVMYASVLSMTGQLPGVEPALQAAERALARVEPLAHAEGPADDETRNLIGHIAAIRALLAAAQNQVETIIAQSQRALEYLNPGNVAVRTATIWKMGLAYQLQGDWTAAARAYTDAIEISQASGNLIINMAATTGLGYVHEAQNQLQLAAETYRRVLELAGDPAHPATGEAHLGLARICYAWHDLAAAEQHAQQSLQLARQYGSIGNRDALCEALLARIRSDRGDADGASAQLAHVAQAARQPLIEPLSQRELEILRLIAQGLSNQAIADRLFLALNTVKGHNRVIFDKLQVQNRTEAVARAASWVSSKLNTLQISAGIT